MKEIVLSKKGKKNKGKYVAFVDDDIFPIVNEYDWTYSLGYAVRNDYSTGKRKNIRLHCYIYELKNGKIPEGYEVDHKDRNSLNNQISNLRLVTHAENMCNISKSKNNTSGYIGVSKKVNKQKNKDKISIYNYWQCSWMNSKGKQERKPFPFNNAGKILAARYFDIMAKQIKGNYTGELNFNSLEEYQQVLKQAILEDIKSN